MKLDEITFKIHLLEFGQLNSVNFFLFLNSQLNSKIKLNLVYFFNVLNLANLRSWVLSQNSWSVCCPCLKFSNLKVNYLIDFLDLDRISLICHLKKTKRTRIEFRLKQVKTEPREKEWDFFLTLVILCLLN